MRVCVCVHACVRVVMNDDSKLAVHLCVLVVVTTCVHLCVSVGMIIRRWLYVYVFRCVHTCLLHRL